MGRYLRKCKKVVDEIAVVGVKTRARAALAMAATSQQGKKIKKVSKSSKSSSSSYDFHQLRSRRRSLSAQQNFVEKDTTSSEASVVEEDVANCSSSEVITTTTTTGFGSPPPCCSSNENQSSSSEVVKDRLGKNVADPEVESAEPSSRLDCNRAAPSEATKSDDQESPVTMVQEANSTVEIKKPSDSEIEEFFAAAEKDLHQRFMDKYNFDIVKDVPLEGRYEWIPTKP